MTIAEARGKCKSLAEAAPRDVLMVAILLLTSLASFGLGWLSGRESVVEQGRSDNSPLTVASSTGQIVASKNGTKYYLPSCTNNIGEANKVWFVSAESAEAAGYTRASNCKGF